MEHYFTESFNVSDPVLAYSAKHIITIQWHDLMFSPASPAERVMNEAGEFGLKVGITMPVHSPHGELGVISFALNQQLKVAHEITQQAMPYIQLLVAHLHEAVGRVFGLSYNIGKLV